MMEALGRILKLVLFSLERLGEAATKACIAFWRYFALHKKARQIGEAALLGLLLLAVAYSFLLAAPAGFPEQSLISVKKGSTLESVASNLKKHGLINSATLFEFVARVYRNDGVVVAGEYAFAQPQNILTMAKRFTQGDFELEPIKVRVVEGMNAKEIASLLAQSVPDFDQQAFYTLALAQEGRLFPDTYFVLPGEDPDLVVSAMTSNFNVHIRQVQVASAVAAFGKPLNDVLTMASILEKEAATTQDRRIIAGILWHRLSIGMRLQVDTAPETYKTAGLPKAPIGSPSLDAIVAAVTPVTTSYVYYLSDKAGVTHYSTTYDQHLAKKAKYLDN